VTFEYNGKVYKTEVEMKMAQRRDGNLPLPSLDFACKGENCNCAHHKE
jgi:hypothetical protein